MLSATEVLSEKLHMLSHIDVENDNSDDAQSPVTRRRNSQQFAISHLFSIVVRFLKFLIPSFISTRFNRNTTISEKPLAIHSATAWLDGLRGWAAYIVFLHHTTYLFVDINWGWGSNGEYYDWHRLPFAHLLLSGHSAVSIFFVVSGFALSIKPLKQMRNGRIQADLLTTLSSGALRRPIRLYGPIVATTFSIFILSRLGAFDATRSFLWGMNTRFDDGHLYIQAPGFFEGLYHYVKSTVNFFLAEIYHWSDDQARYPYDTHLWTLPIEFRSSYTLFATQLAVARLRTATRIPIMLGLVILAVYQDYWAIMLFWGGMLLCELQMMFLARKQGGVIIGEEATKPQRQWLSTYQSAGLHLLNTVTALYLLSMPDEGADSSPFYSALIRWSPPYMRMRWRFWVAIGAFQLVAGAAFATPALGRFSLAAIFSSPISRYMGNISYALYIGHGMANHLIGVPLFYYVFQFTGQETPLGWALGMTLCIALQTVVVVWVGDVLWRLVDKPSVIAARRFEEWCLLKAS